MIGYLSGKGQKKAAWVFFFLFYFQFAVEAYTGIHNSRIYYFYSPGGEYKNLNSAFNRNHLSSTPANFDAASNLNTTVPKEVIKNNIPVNSASQSSPLIGGPGQPEMSTFKSIGADKMVDLFTGDFSYNIPFKWVIV